MVTGAPPDRSACAVRFNIVLHVHLPSVAATSLPSYAMLFQLLLFGCTFRWNADLRVAVPASQSRRLPPSHPTLIPILSSRSRSLRAQLLL